MAGQIRAGLHAGAADADADSPGTVRALLRDVQLHNGMAQTLVVYLLPIEIRQLERYALPTNKIRRHDKAVIEEANC